MDSFLTSVGLGDSGWLAPAIAGTFLLVAVVLAGIFHFLLFPLVIRMTGRTSSDIDNRIVRATRFPLTLGIVVLGIYLSLTIPLDLNGKSQGFVDTVTGVLALLLGIVAFASLVSQAFEWYIDSVGSYTRSRMGLRVLPLLRRITTAMIYGIGALLILDLLSVNINPLVASLGLGGLAVALAIQPTLANLFAGTYVMTEGAINPGDYIELEGSVSGYVIEVGWRSTRIRTWGNNLVVIPNAKFAETIITNFNEPQSAVNVFLPCGVSYDSDLARVEEVSREVMAQELEENPHAVKEYGAWFAFDTFADSNVNFWLFVQAKDRLGSFVLQSSLIKRLHHRFGQEAIVINYPIRTLQFPEGWGPQALVAGDGSIGKGRYGRKRSSRRLGARRRPSGHVRTSAVPTDSEVVGGDAEGPGASGAESPGGGLGAEGPGA